MADHEIAELRKLLKAIQDKEVEDLRAVLGTYRALRWVATALKHLALWITAVVGGITAYKAFMPIYWGE